MNISRYIYRKLIAVSLFLILSLSIFTISVNFIHPVSGGKYGNIVPTIYEIQLLEKINENRTANGAGELRFNASLCWVARAHSQDMINHDFFNHTSSEEGPFAGATFYERVGDYAEYESPYIGETLAIKTWGIDVESTMASWKNSPSHWDIIIDPNFHEIGLGLLEGEWNGSPNAGLHTAVYGGGSVSIDLSIDGADIGFEPSSPYEGQDVIITATIYNQGTTDAYPVNVEFYDGDPDAGGVQIGDEYSISHILIHGESETVNIIWDTKGSVGSHDIYVVVDYDLLISETNEDNNKAFKTIIVSPVAWSIHLDLGWNLVSFPINISNTSMEYVLSSISGEYDAVQTYNSSDTSDSWKHHHISKLPYMNDLYNLDNRIGFWVHVVDSDGADLMLPGEAPSSPQNVTLNEGWNLVGYPSTTKRLRNDALNNLNFGGEVKAILYQDNITKVIKHLDELEYMEPGKGYWIFATEKCEWVVNN
ncbi:MAG: hypothetical protein JSW00_01910 [Thermoplasmata archaeon]|nr:MAG: hypothetical protein JSW00_01910 [Thermoplasmata archaeon]